MGLSGYWSRFFSLDCLVSGVLRHSALPTSPLKKTFRVTLFGLMDGVFPACGFVPYFFLKRSQLV
ncbi:protein of unknown function [Nitrospina watsonii]|uniref:Uncharacterized protein n=1 Tax=Nitrospina watsonii TaxID=1323948 RepID=A0ABN8W5S2_9BACT|nr:protein of unknown function [Nitrospina watsonii]